MRYRRLKIPGATYFFTVVVHERRPIFHDAVAAGVWLAAIAEVQRKRPFDLTAFVILPDHGHFIWTLPDGDSDFSTRWMLIKSSTRRRLMKLHLVSGQVWQHRFWEHCIRDDRDFDAHLDYVHFNPAKHGYVDDPMDWLLSSIKRYHGSGDGKLDWMRVEKLALSVGAE
mgnify:FL=1